VRNALRDVRNAQDTMSARNAKVPTLKSMESVTSRVRIITTTTLRKEGAEKSLPALKISSF